jgi:hypothetical protein
MEENPGLGRGCPRMIEGLSSWGQNTTSGIRRESGGLACFQWPTISPKQWAEGKESEREVRADLEQNISFQFLGSVMRSVL